MVLGLFKPDPSSGQGVRREYTSRINAFFNRVKDGPHNKLDVDDSPLDALFSWAENAATLSKKYQFERDNQARARFEAEKTVDQLEARLRATEKDLSNATETLRRERAEHAQQVQNLVISHSAEEEKWKEERRQRNDQHKKEMDKVVGQLLDNQDDILGWTDDKLKIKFRELQRQVEAIASPNRKELKIPPTSNLNSHLDPSGFFRGHKGRLHILLKSIIWAIFNDQFFATPFGFGALGPEQGKAELLKLLRERQKLLRGGGVSTMSESDLLAVFETEKLANTWRSSTFQSIIAAASGNSQVSRLYQSNIEDTVNRIMGVFDQITALSGAKLPEAFERDIHQLTRLVGELAFQFGVHPAHLEMRVPAYGEKVQIGPDYQDCEDGDEGRGKKFGVELVVLPGLQKIGDGRADMISARTIVPCEIWPMGI